MRNSWGLRGGSLDSSDPTTGWGWQGVASSWVDVAVWSVSYLSGVSGNIGSVCCAWSSGGGAGSDWDVEDMAKRKSGPCVNDGKNVSESEGRGHTLPRQRVVIYMILAMVLFMKRCAAGRNYWYDSREATMNMR